jgi:tetratricopeptide (TPR) repeat protein
VEAAIILRRAGRRLSETRLAEAPWGEIVQEVAGRLGRLDGQLTLPLDEHCLSLDEVFHLAEQSELEGDLATAERWYRAAMRMDRKDPVLAFNLGNVLDGQGRSGEAILAYWEAIARDPTFAEGWLNLGVLSENGGRIEEALTYYGRSVEARPDYADAVFALARLLTAEERYEAALPLWERYLRLELASENAARARRLAALCRLGLSATQTPPGAGVRPPFATPVNSVDGGENSSTCLDSGTSKEPHSRRKHSPSIALAVVVRWRTSCRPTTSMATSRMRVRSGAWPQEQQ